MHNARYRSGIALVFVFVFATINSIIAPCQYARSKPSRGEHSALAAAPTGLPTSTGAGLEKATVAADYGKLPIAFEPNQGQAPSAVRFVSRSAAGSLFFTPTGATVLMAKGDSSEGARAPQVHTVTQPKNIGQGKVETVAIEMKLKGAKENVQIDGKDRLHGTDNYILGNNPSQWRTGIPTYAGVSYRQVYPGIDLTYHGSNQCLEYDFSVAPHADPRLIRLSFRGVKAMRVDGNGDLVLSTAVGEIRQLKPTIYQQDGETKHYVSGRYSIRGRGEVGFQVESYDRSKELVIDPIFVYSTFLGGTASDMGKAITVDSFGNAYITGSASSFNFPVTVGAFQTTFAAANDVFVTKLDPTGSSLVYSTFIGGNGNDNPTSIAVDGSGNAYVAGTAGSTNFPVTAGAYDTTEPVSFSQRGFVAKLNSTGSSLVYSTFFGPGGQQFSPAVSINGIQVDSFGIAYITGWVFGTLPTTGDAQQAGSGGLQDAFFTKLKADGSALVYSTYLGGAGNETGNGITIDSAGDAFIAGNTSSTDFPTTAGAFQTTFGGKSPNSFSGFAGDCFVAKYDPSGNLSYSTYLGGSLDESALAIAIDSMGNAYITGETTSPNFPSTAGSLRTASGGAFKTTNSGATWGPIDSGLTNSTIQALAIDPEVPPTVYAGTQGGGIFRSTDGGNTWTAINSGLTDMSVQSIAVDPTNSNVIYLGTSQRGVFKSLDGGGSWNAVDTGEGGSSVTSLAIDPIVPGTVLAATNSGVFRTTNGGGMWAGPLVSGNSSLQALAFDPANHLTVYFAGGTVFKSLDGGVTWSPTALSNASAVSLAIDQSSAIYAATFQGVQKSSNGGTTWSLVDTGITDLNILAVAVGSSAVYAGANSGIFKSANGGATWSPANAGTTGGIVKVIAIDPATQSNVYFGSSSAGTDAFVTKLNSDGSALVYSTYLGGSSTDIGEAIAVDANGNPYVTGQTSSTNFPTAPGGLPSAGNNFFFGTVGYVSKLNTDGAGLVYSTLFDTQGTTSGNGIAVDSSLNAYVVGQTSDSSFPVTPGAYQTHFASSFSEFNGFVSKIQSSPGLSADLQITQTQMPTGTLSGNITYTVIVTNHGPDPAYQVTLLDNLPTGLVTSVCCSGQQSDTFIDNLGTLASGAMMTVTVSASLNCATAVNGSTATNTVTVSSLTPDPTPANNSASVSNTLSISGSTSISPQSISVPASGVSFNEVMVTAPPCEWQAFSNAPWIFLNFLSSSGNGFIEYSVSPNSGPPRTGTMTIAGKTFEVIQDGLEGTYGGSLDGAGCNIIAGWAWDQTNPSAAVSVDIYDGSNYVATTTASMYREDLLNVLGSPNHGFALPTPASLRDGATHSITVKVSGTNITIPGSPRSLRCNEASQSLQGFLDGVGCDTISGWAWDGHDPGNIVNVDFYADGQLLGTIAATQYRQDLANVFGQPFHGYTFPTPASLKDGKTHTIMVKFGGTNTSLSNSPKSFSCNSTPSYAGSLDPANCTSITGFIWDTNDPVATVNAAIYADGNFLVVVPAQQVSPGVGDGFHGFIFAVPASLKNSHAHTITVKASGTNFTVANAPITLTCP